MEHYYTVYLAETDEIVAFGSVAECAKQMGKSILGFQSLVSKNKLGKNHKYVIVIDDDDIICEDAVDNKRRSIDCKEPD